MLLILSFSFYIWNVSLALIIWEVYIHKVRIMMITIIKKEDKTFRSDGYVYKWLYDDFTNGYLSPTHVVGNTLNMYGFFYVNYASKSGFKHVLLLKVF